MYKFGERERNHVVRFIEKTKDCKITRLGKRRKFFGDDSGRHWWILGGVPRQGWDGWHGIQSDVMQSEHFDGEGTLVVAVWYESTIDIFAAPLSELFAAKESLYLSKEGNYRFSCRAQAENLEIYGRREILDQGMHQKSRFCLFVMHKMGEICYKQRFVESCSPEYHRRGVIERGVIRAVISESEGWYVAECLDAAIVTQGRSLDKLLENLREVLALHFDDEEIELRGQSSALRLVLSYETQAFLSRA